MGHRRRPDGLLLAEDGRLHVTGPVGAETKRPPGLAPHLSGWGRIAPGGPEKRLPWEGEPKGPPRLRPRRPGRRSGRPGGPKGRRSAYGTATTCAAGTSSRVWCGSSPRAGPTGCSTWGSIAPSPGLRTARARGWSRRGSACAEVQGGRAGPRERRGALSRLDPRLALAPPHESLEDDARPCHHPAVERSHADADQPRPTVGPFAVSRTSRS